jgi:hypothetical protein
VELSSLQMGQKVCGPLQLVVVAPLEQEKHSFQRSFFFHCSRFLFLFLRDLLLLPLHL